TLREGEAMARVLPDTGAAANQGGPGDETGTEPGAPRLVKWRYMEPDFVLPPVTTPQQDGRSYTYGVVTPVGDPVTVIAYMYQPDPQRPEGTLVPAEQVVACKVGVDSNTKRGLPFLYTAAKWLEQYDKWLDDRVILNKVRTAI